MEFDAVVDGVHMRGSVSRPQDVADGAPKYTLGVLTSIDQASHLDLGVFDTGQFSVFVCNHTTGSHSLAIMTRAEFAAVAEGIASLLEQHPETCP